MTGASATPVHGSALWRAAEAGDVDLARMLVERDGVDPDRPIHDGCLRPLRLAATMGYDTDPASGARAMRIAGILLAVGADPDLVAADGLTPLLAVCMGPASRMHSGSSAPMRRQMVALLLAAGAGSPPDISLDAIGQSQRGMRACATAGVPRAATMAWIWDAMLDLPIGPPPRADVVRTTAEARAADAAWAAGIAAAHPRAPWSMTLLAAVGASS